MLDTTNEMLQKQREIIFKKSPSERFMIGIDAISFGRIMVESSIKQDNPQISGLDFKIAVLKRYYETVFNQSEFNNIVNSLKYYYLHKEEIINKGTQHHT